ncbi:raffinose/stachyose/melibiose transport system permease protein [Nocardiopsis terrae]|uniref:Raffinose/stachyose/melibiose transport system permease protein n=1 Tax=Nocardiopsis terrae TaxID=372655 RepID=A0ABR9HG29_9ACTN|nr:sugar ABC transporter permease [Nocardiopsis terrae]MBE1457988.1 raffinose/stachyose/melibiose transport system permease protein [Nocardiopsis terrae]
MLPALAFFAFAALVPSARGALYSFTDWDGLARDYAFVGLDQYRALFSDGNARSALGHTLLIAFAVTVVQNAVGLLLALGVNSRIKSRNVLRVFFFAPAVITPVVTAYLWKYLYSPQGAINAALDSVGLGAVGQDWLGDSDIALWSVVAVIVWQFSGYSMVIFLAGLQSIPQEIYEASDMDGAGPFRRFWHIVRPMLAPALTINLMLSLIGGLKLFDQVWVMTQGGPGGATDTLSTVIYREAFQFNAFAYSTAMAVVLTLFVIVLSGVQYGYLGRQEKRNS